MDASATGNSPRCRTISISVSCGFKDANDNDIDMDDLNYTYKNGLSNLLVNVADAVTTGSNEGFKDGNTDPNLDDYEYDANGNMIKDRNKGISNITYNHLNLPTQIEFEGTNNKITYLYNSVGQKLKKTVVYSDSIKIVDYLDGFQYAGNVLQFFPHAEGYVKATPTDILNTNYGYNYVFNYTDHLGNIRVSYSKDPQTHQLKILEENHYYPFGLKHSVYTAGRLRDFEVDFSNPEGEHVFLNNVTKTEYQYKFGAKEYQDELNLNLYDFGARNYDPALGRWMNVDPLAEKNNFESPYVFVHNNPIIYFDPDGRDGIIVIKGNQISINSNIYLYGPGATKAVASQYQADINSRWGGSFSTKTSDGSQSFNVNVNVNVSLYKGKEKSNPWIIPESWNPFNRDNFIEVSDNTKRSYVRGGDEGEWRSQGRNGLSLEDDNPASHELGHLLGLDDRYTDKNGPDEGWENNIMGNSQNGKVEQKNIDGILQDAMKAYEVWSKDKNNAGKEFRYEININNPNK